MESLVLFCKRTTVHVSDDTGRIAMLEKRTFGNEGDDHGTAEELTRYIYSNHLQSASLELDETGEVISYEEYHPYGTTSYQAMNASIHAVAKRYRYTGKEGDEESGLYYHGARYYASWLCRWVSPDPINSEWYNLTRGEPDRNLKRTHTELSASPYEYCYDNPVRFTDPNGEQVPYEGINTPIVVDKLRVNRRVIIEDVFFDHTKLHPLKIEEIIKRDEWNAREPIIELGRNYESIEIPLKDYYNTIVIHHSGNSVDYPTVQSVQNEHMDGALNAADIGYHFAIDRYGKIYEGRPIDIVGSHVKSANTGKIGIVLLADLDTEDKGILFDFSDGYVTKEMRESLYRLSIYLIKEYEIEYLGSHKEIINERNCAGNLGQTEVECLRKDTETQKPESIELQKTKPQNKNKNGMQFGPGTIKY